MRFIRSSTSEEETARIGRALAGLLRAGDVVTLSGDLGAGKTTLVRSIAAALGIDTRSVNSPTFALVNEYEREEGPDVVHVDAYRLSGPDDVESVGWDNVLRPDAIVVIEWPERIEESLPNERARVEIDHQGEHERTLAFDLPRSWTGRDGLAPLAQRGDTTCPVTGAPVPADSPTWPFANERARMADLYRWMSGAYEISRPIEEADLEQGD